MSFAAENYLLCSNYLQDSSLGELLVPNSILKL